MAHINRIVFPVQPQSDRWLMALGAAGVESHLQADAADRVAAALARLPVLDRVSDRGQGLLRSCGPSEASRFRCRICKR
jgi:hypothetical protein